MVELVVDRLDPDGHGETAWAAAFAGWLSLWAALAADYGHHALEAELGHGRMHALPRTDAKNSEGRDGRWQCCQRRQATQRRTCQSNFRGIVRRGAQTSFVQAG